MHVTRTRLTRWVASATLLAGLGLAAGGAGAGAQADTGGGSFLIYTQIALSGDVYSDGSSPNAPSGWTPPKCWLQLNSGFGVDPASTPDEFAAYMGQVYAFLHHAQEDALQQAIYQLYYKGIGVDPGVGLTSAPYNEALGNSGAWYGMACSLDSGYGDYVALAAEMGANNPDENWFWLPNGTPPAGVPVMDPNLLAEYAAANTRVTPGWPNFSPRLTAMQTVNLATLITNGAGQNGFRRYTATASIPTGQSSTVHATPSRVTFTSSGPTSPRSVTCYFNANGSLRSGCQLTFLKSTSSGYTVTESSMWNVTWGGDPVTGEPGWTRQIGPVTIVSGPVLVQEIQTIVGH